MNPRSRKPRAVKLPATDAEVNYNMWVGITAFVIATTIILLGALL